MYHIIKLAIISLLISFFLHAGEINGILTTKQQSADLRLGTPVLIQLIIWPHKDLYLNELLDQIKKQPFLNVFSVSEIFGVVKSEENADAVVLSMNAVVVGKCDTKLIQIHSDAKNHINIEFRNISFSQQEESKGELKEESQQNSLIILNQDYRDPSWPCYYYLVLGLVFFAIAIVLKVYLGIRKRKKKAQLRQLHINSWKQKFEQAKERKDFELIYASRFEWEEFLTISSAEMKAFKELMEKIQYKEVWNDSEMIEIQTLCEKIRGML